MIIYDFVIRRFIVACELNYLSRPFFSYITSASVWIRLLFSM